MLLDRQPTLQGPTITLRPLYQDDLDALYRAASDPLIWDQHPANRHELAEFDDFVEDTLRSGGALVVLAKNGEVIGTSRYSEHDVDACAVEIGWTFLKRDHWGGTTNRELKTLMIDHAFTAVDCITFRVRAQNQRSQRAVEKLGARRTTVDADDWVHFELTRDAWSE